MFGPKIKVSDALYQKVKEAAAMLGCASVEEYASKVLETDTSRVLSKKVKGAASEAEVNDLKNKLKGLGYIE